MSEWIGVGIALLVAIAGMITSLKALRSNDAEASRNYAEAAIKVIEDNKRLRELVNGLEKEIRIFRNLVRTLEDELDKLRDENRMLTRVNDSLREKLKEFEAFQSYLDSKRES